MYQFESRVRYSETDNHGLLTLEGILDYFQDCSTFHSEDLGIGIEYLKGKNMAWVLSYWQIVVKRYPRMGEKLLVGTMPYDARGFLGFRNFVLYTEDGEELACANSIWTLLDTEKGMPCKVPDGLMEIYGLAEKYPMDYAPRKIALPEEMKKREAIEIRRHHLDTNMHVNNGQYVRMAMDTAMEEGQVVQLRAEYKKSAVLGDVIYPYTAKDETSRRYLVSLCSDDRKPYAVVELTYA